VLNGVVKEGTCNKGPDNFLDAYLRYHYGDVPRLSRCGRGKHRAPELVSTNYAYGV
jgi:hypothetical protein